MLLGAFTEVVLGAHHHKVDAAVVKAIPTEMQYLIVQWQCYNIIEYEQERATTMKLNIGRIAADSEGWLVKQDLYTTISTSTYAGMYICKYRGSLE